MPSKEWINEKDEVCYNGASLCDCRIIQQILCSYQSLRQKSRGDFLSDTWYLIEDFDRVYAQAMEPYPMYRRIVEYKMEGRGNREIKELLQQEFGHSHTVEYISTLWRNKIPRLIARQAQENFLMWYHTTQVKSRWKKCTRCGQIKLEHSFFFSKNNTVSSGFYCVCKECRRKRVKK